MTKSTWFGFSLPDAIILLAVLAAAAMILVHTAQTARAQAQQKNQQKLLQQCAIAVHNYHGDFRKLPDASAPGGIYDGKAERSLWFHLLPYVDEDNAYKNNKHDAVVNAYLVHEDRSVADKAGKINLAGNIRIFGFKALGSSLANNAVTTNMQGAPSGKNLKDKLAPSMPAGLTLARIPDGTSNVFMLATRYADCGSPVQSTYYSASPTGIMLGRAGPVDSVGLPKNDGKGAFFGAGSHHKPADATSIDATFQVAPKVDKCLADNAVFGHSFGDKSMQAALCDGSVRSILVGMTPTTFCRALCPSDGFPLDNDWVDD